MRISSLSCSTPIVKDSQLRVQLQRSMAILSDPDIVFGSSPWSGRSSTWSSSCFTTRVALRTSSCATSSSGSFVVIVLTRCSTRSQCAYDALESTRVMRDSPPWAMNFKWNLFYVSNLFNFPSINFSNRIQPTFKRLKSSEHHQIEKEVLLTEILSHS